MRLLRGSKEVGNDQNRTRSDKLLYRPQSLVVAAGIAYGLFGEQLGMRTAYHSPENSSGSSGK
jgi:hypothetical protein